MLVRMIVVGDAGECDTDDRKRKREQLDGARWIRRRFRGTRRSCRIELLSGRGRARWLGCGGSKLYEISQSYTRRGA